ncbi:MAG TPA: DUF58 domain-containing protein [Verrucomicrobiae bacterium]|nr:DUF58 domain-containing protein [Verrucomicrobiae bacterium]
MNAIWRLLYRLYRMGSGFRYRATRRFTPAGLVVLVALSITSLMGMDMESTVAYQAFSLLLFLILVSFCFGWLFRAKFSATRHLPRFATVGKPFNYVVTVSNRAPQVQTDLVLIEDLADPRPDFSEWQAVQLAEQKKFRSLRVGQRRNTNWFRLAVIKEAVIAQLPSNDQVEARVEVVPLRRGVLRYRGVTIGRADPLGLFRALTRFPLPQTLLILPKRYVLPPIALPGTVKYQEGGIALASNVGQSEEFVALRDYRRGDPLRHIHWRSWARTGKPIVKEYADEFFVRHALVLDTFSNDPRSELFEEAVSVAASFACVIQTQESLLDLLFVGAQAYCFTAGRGLAHGDQMLEILASVRTCREKPFQALEALVLDHASIVSGCVCVFLEWDASRRNFVQKLKSFGVPLLVVVMAESTPDPPLDPGPMADEPENFHTLVLGKIEEGLARL